MNHVFCAGLTLKGDKRSEWLELEHSLHVTMAAVAYNSYPPVELLVHTGSNPYHLCTLGSYSTGKYENQVFQVPLNLKFDKGDMVSFSLRPPKRYQIFDAHCDITGYLIPDE